MSDLLSQFKQDIEKTEKLLLLAFRQPEVPVHNPTKLNLPILERAMQEELYEVFKAQIGRSMKAITNPAVFIADYFKAKKNDAGKNS